MREKPSDKAEAGRVLHGPWGSDRHMPWGAFEVMGPCGCELRIMATDGDDPGNIGHGWEHVSVSTERRPPNWQEMAWVKDQFWDDEETVLQFHPKKSEYVNCHPYCLHLWRNVGLDHPLPPSILTGPLPVLQRHLQSQKEK